MFVQFNSCSLNANFENICHYLDSLNVAFNITAVSETWAKTDQMSQFYLRGYTTYHVERGYKQGVALYVKDSIDCSIIASKSTTFNNVDIPCVYGTANLCNQSFRVMTDMFRHYTK